MQPDFASWCRAHSPAARRIRVAEKGTHTMHVPGLIERVMVRRRTGVFLVTRVDHERQIAVVIPLNGFGQAAIEVPFAELLPFVEEKTA